MQQRKVGQTPQRQQRQPPFGPSRGNASGPPPRTRSPLVGTGAVDTGTASVPPPRTRSPLVGTGAVDTSVGKQRRSPSAQGALGYDPRAPKLIPPTAATLARQISRFSPTRRDTADSLSPPLSPQKFSSCASSEIGDGQTQSSSDPAVQADQQLQLELDIFQKILHANQLSSRQVEAAIVRVLNTDGASAESSRAPGADLKSLVAQTIDHNAKLFEAFEHLAERAAKGKEDSTVRQQESSVRAGKLSIMEERATMKKQLEDLQCKCETLELSLVECKADCARQISETKLEMGKKAGDVMADCGRTIEATKAEMARRDAELQAERERFQQERNELVRQMHEFRADCEERLREEESTMAAKMAEVHEKCERKIIEEMRTGELRLAESRAQTEEKLRKERQVTERIQHVLRELPPVQAAMELGDLGLLDEELGKWNMDAIPEHFGDCKGVVEAVLKLARERLHVWRGVQCTWKELLAEAEHLPSTLVALTQLSQRIFRNLKESQLTKLDLRRSAPQAMERISDILLAWQARAMAYPNDVHALIVRKTIFWPHLGSFDFADLDICLRLVDREGSEVFLSRARVIAEDPRTAPQQLRPLLAHLETMIFFLKYTTKEDLPLCHEKFREQSGDVIPEVLGYLKRAQQAYAPGCELVTVSGDKDLLDGRTIDTVLKDLRKSPGFLKNDPMASFREIFFQWASAMHSTFNLLVLPHHTQVVCLVVFKFFLEAEKASQTLIAQVGTGEGKSMIIAALVIFIVTVLRKKVHVVVDDETLLERDFTTFKRVFDAFAVPCSKSDNGAETRPLRAMLCLSEERLQESTAETDIKSRIDPEADVCYCEAKHVQSLYASVARGEGQNFDCFQDTVLILDEVDALVIDEEPNDVFVYPNKQLSDMATKVAAGMAKGVSEDVMHKMQDSSHPATGRMLNEMSKEWVKGKQLIAEKDFVFSKEIGKYCALRGGRANPKSWSLALECRNFQDGHSREILFQERLFVTSRPRVFRKYFRILGLSGSVGSTPEQELLKSTYRAAFFKVPPFLTTCRGSPFHDACPTRLGPLQRIVYMEPSLEAQMLRIGDIALDARERVPVLIIARDRTYADQLLEHLRCMARLRGLGAASDDIVRSLSRNLYEANPEQYKENLNRSTMPLGHADGFGKSWRVTVTDPRGGRGTDYRVDDSSVDAQGGLLLICAIVPTSRRDWTQFLGRTARQDCKGQYCCVLHSGDYAALSGKYKEPLDVEGADGGLHAIERILRWGDKESEERIRGSAPLYNTGVRMNELCEEVFGRRRDLLTDLVAREVLVEACQRIGSMSVGDVNDALAKLPNFNPSAIPSESVDVGRPAGTSFTPGSVPRGAMLNGRAHGGPKVVIFCLDWSASMMSRDAGTRLSRFETCIACVVGILRGQVRDHDFVGIVVFGPNVQFVVPVISKGQGGDRLESKIANLRPQVAGGTCFYDAVAQCLNVFTQLSMVPPTASRWLICLTDGDDCGSQSKNARGEVVTQMLMNGSAKGLNLLTITVGALKAVNIQIINGWIQHVNAAGGIGQLLAEKDASTISLAFDKVAEYLNVDVGGAVEC